MKKVLLIAVIFLPLLVFAEDETVGYLGVSTKNLGEAMKIALKIKNGVLVEKVSENSPAEDAGIKIGDLILEVDKNKINDRKELKEIVESRANKKVDVVIYRSGKKLTKRVALGKREQGKIKIEMNVPNISELKDWLGCRKGELKKELDELKEEVKRLKKEIEEIKKEIK